MAQVSLTGAKFELLSSIRLYFQKIAVYFPRPPVRLFFDTSFSFYSSFSLSTARKRTFLFAWLDHPRQQKYLDQLRSAPEAWELAWALLQEGNADEVRYYACILMQAKVHY